MPQNWRRVLSSKPPYGAHINWGHPLAKNLVGAWLCNEGSGLQTVSLVNRNDALIFQNSGVSSIVWQTGVLGACPSQGVLTDAGMLVASPSAGLLQTNVVSIFTRVTLSTAGDSGNNALIAGASYSATSGGFPNNDIAYGVHRLNGDPSGLSFTDFGNSTQNKQGVTGLLTSTMTPMDLGFTFDANGNAIGYFNGRQVCSAARSGPISYITPAFICGYNAQGVDNAGVGQWGVIYVWGRELSPAENIWLHEDPYALVEWKKPRLLNFFGKPPTPGVISPPGIASSFAAGTPTLVGQDQTIVVSSGIASSFVAGTPTMVGGSAQTITVTAGIASSFAAGTPAMVGPAQTVILSAGIPSSFVAGTPALVGGAAGVSLFIGNVFIKYLVPAGLSWPRQGAGGGGGGTGAATGGALTITQTAIGRATYSFDLAVLDGSGYVPRATQTVILMENGKKLFAGCIKAASSDPAPGYGLTSTSAIGFHVDCADKSSICDNRVVIKTYPVGTDVQGMILDIVANFLNGEGITTQGVNVTDTLDSAMVFNYTSVSNAFDQITSLTGAQWWIDFNGVLHFVVIQSSPTAPFGLTATSGNFRNFVSTESTIGYANKFYAVSNLVVGPAAGGGGSITASVTNAQGTGYAPGDTFTVIGGDGTAVGQVDTVGAGGVVLTYTLTVDGNNYSIGVAATSAITGVGTGLNINITAVSPPATGAAGTVRTETYTLDGSGNQAQALAAGLAPGYLLLALPINVLVSVSVNGTPIPVYPFSSGVQPGDGYYWFNGDAQAAVIYPEGFLPAAGATVVVGYIPVFQNATVNSGTPLTGTCGSGVVEGVIQVPNISLQSQLDAIAAAYQLRNGVIPFLISYETDTPGLFVGQKQSIDLPLVGLGNTAIYITTVTMSIEQINEGAAPMPAGSAFRYVIEATTQQNLGNWITWFERFIARTNYPLPVPRYEVAQMVLAPGGSLGGGTVAQNSYVAKNSGLVFAASGQANTPPVGQNLLLQFLVNGSPLLTTPLVIPAGVSTVVYAPAGTIPPGATIYKGDTITTLVSYQTTTLTPTAAGSVSFDLEWSY